MAKKRKLVLNTHIQYSYDPITAEKLEGIACIGNKGGVAKESLSELNIICKKYIEGTLKSHQGAETAKMIKGRKKDGDNNPYALLWRLSDEMKRSRTSWHEAYNNDLTKNSITEFIATAKVKTNGRVIADQMMQDFFQVSVQLEKFCAEVKEQEIIDTKNLEQPSDSFINELRVVYEKLTGKKPTVGVAEDTGRISEFMEFAKLINDTLPSEYQLPIQSNDVLKTRIFRAQSPRT